jgi:hypothetical protein
MLVEIKATELKIIREFDGYTLASHNGNLGIWSIMTETETWDGNDYVPCEPVQMAWEMESDCGSLLDSGHFENHVSDLKTEGSYLASLEVN